MRRILTLSLALALLCTACGRPRNGEDAAREGEYGFYFISDEDSGDGGALAREARTVSEEQETVGGLLQVLLSGPENDRLASPFPQGTLLRSWQVKDGVAAVDLSEAYGGLSGGELSLADGSIVLTLCQLPEVEAVYFTVEGHARPFRDQLLTPADFLLENGLEGQRQVQVRLWFLQGEELGYEERTLSLNMGDREEIAALQALLSGPEERGLDPVCPEGVRLLSLSQQGGCFSVNLSEEWQEGENDPRRLSAIARTLGEITPGAEVIFQVEGQRLERFGGLDLTQPWKEEPAPSESTSELPDESTS